MNTSELGEEVVFFESTAAARSLKNPWTRMASTYDCIQVILSPEHLIVKPRPMLAGLIRALRLDLNHVIPTHQIAAVERTGSFLRYAKIRVNFSAEEGDLGTLMLYLRNPDEFLEQVDQLNR